MSTNLYTSSFGQLIKISAISSSESDPHPSHSQRAVLVADATSAKKNAAVLLAESFEFSESSGQFESSGDTAKLVFRDGQNIKLLQLSKVFDKRTGSKMPCVVIEQESGLTSSQSYQISVVFLSVKRWKFGVLGTFLLPYSLKMSPKLFVKDGPLLCWEYAGNVCVAGVLNASPQIKIDQVALDVNLWKPRSTLKWFGWINDDAVAMGTTKKTHQEDSSMFYDGTHEWVVVKLSGQQTEVSKAPMTAGIAPMPHEYSNIVNCIHLCPNFNESAEATNTVVLTATNQFQLVESIDAIVRRVCKLSFDNACKIAVAMVVGGDELIVVHSASGAVSAVWRESFKVAKEWTDIHTVLIDDFLGTGADQILLLGKATDATPRSFHLTDFGTCNWTASGESETSVTSEKIPTCPANLLSAVEALEAQLQTSMATLRSLESQNNVKARLIQQSEDALYKMAEQQPVLPSQNTSLTCLIDCSGKDGIKQPSQETRPVSQDAQATLRCVEGWQRVALGQWIVGVELENKTERCIGEIHISLIPDSTSHSNPNSAISTCKYKSLRSSQIGDTRTPFDREPAEKRLKPDPFSQDTEAILEPGQRTTAVAAMDIPDFVSKPVVKCSVLLGWKELHPDNEMDAASCDGAGADREKFVEKRSDCGTAVLYASDMVAGKLDVNPLDPTKSEHEYIRDMQALNAAQLGTSLILTSRYSDLKCLEGRLESSMGFQRLPKHDGMMRPSGHPSLGLIRVRIEWVDGASKMGIAVYTRNQSELVLFCQLLYQQLPDDVIIEPRPPDNQIAMETPIKDTSKEPHSSSMVQGHRLHTTDGPLGKGQK